MADFQGHELLAAYAHACPCSHMTRLHETDLVRMVTQHSTTQDSACQLILCSVYTYMVFFRSLMSDIQM